MIDNTKRFSDRVENYTKFRPSYPKEMVDYLVNDFGINYDSIIADIGSGTGKFTELLLSKCKLVYAVEPNLEMRSEAEKILKRNEKYVSINGTAEQTTLSDNVVDIITVAQAFHWFDMNKTKAEFQRILKTDGSVIIVANKRLFDTEFLNEYEHILRENIPEYSRVNHYRITSEEVQTFYNRDYKQKTFEYKQTFDWQGLIGRLNSSSYTPKKETKEHKIIEEKLREIFDKWSVAEKIDFHYETIVQSGKIN